MEKIFHRALSRKVLAVVVLNTSPDGLRGDYACYVDAVDGERHEDEFTAVSKTGNKQSFDFTKAVFGGLVEELESHGYSYRK
jgi:hypothetical protein